MSTLEQDFARIFRIEHNKLYSPGELPLAGRHLSVSGAHLLLRRQGDRRRGGTAVIIYADVLSCQRMVFPWQVLSKSIFDSAWHDLLGAVAKAWPSSIHWDDDRLELSEKEIGDIALLAHIPSLVNFMLSERAWWHLAPEKRIETFCRVLRTLADHNVFPPEVLTVERLGHIKAFARACCLSWCDELTEALAKKYKCQGRIKLIPQSKLESDEHRFLLENELRLRVKRSDLIGWDESGSLMLLCPLNDPSEAHVVFDRLSQCRWSVGLDVRLVKP